MSDEQPAKEDPEPYILPSTTYVTPEEVLKRYSASIYETEYASSFDGASIPEDRAKEEPSGGSRPTPKPSSPTKSRPIRVKT
jgi:hypothetical protein